MLAVDSNLYFANLLLLALPLSVLLNRVRSAAAVEWTLALAGMYLVFLVAPRYVVFWFGYWVFVALAASALRRVQDDRARRLVLWIALGALLSPMLAWKLQGDAFVQPLNDALQTFVSRALPPLRLADEQAAWIVPLGLSFSTFRAMDLVIKCYLELVDRVPFRRVLFYGFFPPILMVGPIIQIDEVAQRDLDSLRDNYAAALGRMLVGAIKIFVLSAPFATSQSSIVNFADHSAGEVWAGALIFSLYLYVNFSGFSDLSIGAARLFGYRLRENFNMPYLRPNLQELWANFHMSLTGWAQRNVFVPLGGYRKETQYRAVFLTMMVVALWHNVNWSLVLFGLLHAIVLVWLRVRPRASEPGNVGYLVRCFGTYLFFSLTLPLYLLPFGDVLKFYARLIGLDIG